jgi:hypothetical protein
MVVFTCILVVAPLALKVTPYSSAGPLLSQIHQLLCELVLRVLYDTWHISRGDIAYFVFYCRSVPKKRSSFESISQEVFMARQAGSRVASTAFHRRESSADAHDESESLSERDSPTVVLNLSRLHDLIDDRRADAVQAARDLCPQSHIPSTAILSNGSLQVWW